jgi:hypothetical protein
MFFFFSGISANPEIIIKYFSHDGYVCSEGFTDADAKVVCRVNSFAYGRAFKASGKGSVSSCISSMIYATF